MKTIKEYIDILKKNAYELSSEATEPSEIEAVGTLSLQIEITEAVFKETKNITE